ncbi:MAG: ribose-phosphate diphosphokinase, partial [Kiritimatiellae bacterium]|nr:ribose-phosphate diphosphokinase [Kiritimatiellia bacterium]
HLHASPIIVKHLKEQNFSNPVIVSPDMGAAKAAYAYSRMLGCGLGIAAKRRIDANEVENLTIVGDVEGCTAIMVDDLTTTAGTLCSAADAVMAAGASEVHAVVTHAAITQMGLERLKASIIKQLVVTDTIPLNEEELSMFPITVLSVAELLGEAIVRIHEDQSVTSLFRM